MKKRSAKKVTFRVLFGILIILIAGFFYMNPLLPIITGYAAKNLASGVFVADRTQESLESTDLNFSFIKFVKNRVDMEKKEVKSRFLWHRSTAIYQEGFGCTLVNDFTPAEISNRPWKIVPSVPANPDTIAWPAGNLIADTLPFGVNTGKLEAAISKAFADTIPHKGTFAVMVVYKGQPIAEKYDEGFTQNTRFLSWSMAKSVTNALTGILVKEGRLALDQPVGFPEWQNDDRKDITLRHLMHMNSGLEWNENYGNDSDVNNMLHKEGDFAAFTLNKKLESPVGTVWNYSSGTSNIVSLIIRQAIGNDAEYYAFPRQALFNRIGMTSAIFEVDPSGTFVGSSYVYATMRDYARFGLLFLNGGNWQGEQVLPEGWSEFSAAEAPGSDGQYGAFFWINQSGIFYPDVPRDMYCCRGHDGQYIYIIPSKQLVVVRTGFSKKGTFDLNEFLSDIVNSVE
ncbi:MAG: serine hydrolase [Bacteroidales bacterium]|nr:serine hydrolase [Bacteroidales bacterium]